MSTPITVQQIRNRLKLTGGDLTGTLSGTIIKANRFEGFIDYAESAKNDDDGNQIRETYIANIDAVGKRLTFYNKIGEAIGTLTTHDEDNKVLNESNSNRIGYITATPTLANNIGTQIYDSNVYLTERAGELYAQHISGSTAKFDGDLEAKNIYGNVKNVHFAESASMDAKGNVITQQYVAKLVADESSVIYYNAENEMLGRIVVRDSVDKVTNILDTNVKAYITGTKDSVSNVGTQVFDTGVYLTDNKGELFASSLVSDKISVNSALEAKQGNFGNVNVSSTLNVGSNITASNAIFSNEVTIGSLTVENGITGIVTSATDASHAVNADIASKVGTATVGGIAQFIYLNKGVATATSATIGDENNPVYINNGIATKVSAVSSALNAELAERALMADKVGVENIGADNNPIYVNKGVLTKISNSYGNSKTPIYIDKGIIKTCSLSLDDILGGGTQISMKGDLKLEGNLLTKNGGLVGSMDETNTIMTADIDTENNISYIKINKKDLINSGNYIPGTIELKAQDSVNQAKLTLNPSGVMYWEGTVDADEFIGDLRGTADVANKIGTKTVGGENNPIYIKDGVPTAFSKSYGNVNTPIYIDNGIIKSCESVNSVENANEASKLSVGTVGSNNKLIYFNNGVPVESNLNAGGTKLDEDGEIEGFTPVYIEGGLIKEYNQTVGSLQNPLYLQDGKFVPCDTIENANVASKLGSDTVGSESIPIYLNKGVPTTCLEYVPTTGGTFTGGLNLELDNSLMPAITINNTNNQNAVNIISENYTKSIIPDENIAVGINFYGSNVNSLSDRIGYIQEDIDLETNTKISMGIYDPTGNTDSTSEINVVYPMLQDENSNLVLGEPYATAPSYSDLTDSSNKIATTEWVANHVASYYQPKSDSKSLATYYKTDNNYPLTVDGDLSSAEIIYTSNDYINIEIDTPQFALAFDSAPDNIFAQKYIQLIANVDTELGFRGEYQFANNEEEPFWGIAGYHLLLKATFMYGRVIIEEIDNDQTLYNLVNRS